MRLQPVRHESLVELVYRSVRESILSGRFAMGDRLVETRIADELGVGRAPVREALRRLREEQLVLDLPRRGSVVRTFDANDLVDIYNLRLFVEAGAVRLAVRLGTPTRSLRDKIRLMEKAAVRADTAAVADAEFGFHQALCAASQNAYLESVFRTLSAQIQIALSLDNSTYDLKRVADEHVLLVDLMDARDEAGAVQEIRRHILSTVGQVIVQLGGNADRLLSIEPDYEERPASMRPGRARTRSSA